jgi:hypothetical protein
MMLQPPPEGNPPPPNPEIPVPPPTTPATVALSERDKVQKVVGSNDFMIWSLILVGICLLAAVLFYFLERWRKRGVVEDTREDSLSLSNFREMYENGEITEAEYKKVRDKLAAQMKNKLGLPTKPSTSNGLKPVLPPEPSNPDSEPPKPPDTN